MKTIKNKLKAILTLLFLVVMVTSCETGELEEQLNDPSRITPENADPDLLLNNAQLQFIRAFAFNEGNEDGLNVRTSETMRMTAVFGPYAGPFSLTSGNINNNLWRSFYRETLKDIETLLPLAEDRGLLGVAGVAKLIKAYSYVTIVDTWGDVPFTEASNATDFANPNPDGGQFIYNAMFDLIDEAIADINTPNSVMPSDDLFYNGDKNKWITMARTLKFKMYAQMRLIGDFSTEMDALITQGLIETAADDFEFNYSTVRNPIDSRHPFYAISYDSDGTGDYMSNYYMNLFKTGKSGTPDPRLRYYFYRQTNEDPEGDDLPCDAVGTPLCYIGDGYIGRAPGDDLGVPNDGTKRTTYGLYPFGGTYDGNNFKAAEADDGAGGAGIQPLMLSFYIDFLRAESALMNGTQGDPRALLEKGIRASMNKVLNFRTESINLGTIVTEDDEDTPIDETEIVEDFILSTTAQGIAIGIYVNEALTLYDNATTNTERLDVIMMEYYLALWGNGYEAWNNYRRTSLPSDLRITGAHIGVPGLFPRTFMYPAAEVNANSNINQKTLDVRTFWDTNPDNLD